MAHNELFNYFEVTDLRPAFTHHENGDVTLGFLVTSLEEDLRQGSREAFQTVTDFSKHAAISSGMTSLMMSYPMEKIIDDEIATHLVGEAFPENAPTETFVESSSEKYFQAIRANLQAMIDKIDALQYCDGEDD